MSSGSLKLTGSGGGLVMAITYAKLVALVDNHSLVANAVYKITDFQTVHNIPETALINTGPVEPIFVTALDNTNLSEIARSSIYPEDILGYQLIDDSSANPNDDTSKGRIFYRKDTLKNIEAHYDWRYCKFARWEDADGSANFIVSTDNGFAYELFKTFADGFDSSNVSIGKTTDYWWSVSLTNIVFFSDAADVKVGNECYGLTIDSNCYTSEILNTYSSYIKLMSESKILNCSAGTFPIVISSVIENCLNLNINTGANLTDSVIRNSTISIEGGGSYSKLNINNSNFSSVAGSLTDIFITNSSAANNTDSITNIIIQNCFNIGLNGFCNRILCKNTTGNTTITGSQYVEVSNSDTTTISNNCTEISISNCQNTTINANCDNISCIGLRGKTVAGNTTNKVYTQIAITVI